MKKFFTSIIFIFFLCFNFVLQADDNSIFAELDKIPDGAHAGQWLIGLTGAWGYFPFGELNEVEKNFTEKFYYTFDNETTKLLLVANNTVAINLWGEYMPIDYLGIRFGFQHYIVSQYSYFGSNYQNWRGICFRAESFNLGPAVHLTNRKRWDVCFIPYVGVGGAKLFPAPVLGSIKTEYQAESSNFFFVPVFGAEVNFTAYFSGGIFFSFGVNYCLRLLSWQEPVALVNPYTNKSYNDGNSSLKQQSLDFVITFGYAVFN